MLSLKKSSAVLALGMSLTLGLAACGSNDTEAVGAGSSSKAPSSAPSPAAALDSLTGKQTAVTLDPAFLKGITALKLTPATIGGATLDAATGKIAFPITGGNVTYFDPKSGVTPFVTGMISHDKSGLSLTGGGKKVELTDFVVDPGKSMLTGKVTVDGKVAFPSAPLFFLDGSTVKPLDTTSQPGFAVLEGTTVSLTKAAADALNGVFGVTALTEFFPVGIAEITLALPKS